MIFFLRGLERFLPKLFDWSYFMGPYNSTHKYFNIHFKIDFKFYSINKYHNYQMNLIFIYQK